MDSDSWQITRRREVLALLRDIMTWTCTHRPWWQRRHGHVWWEHWEAPYRICRRCGLVDDAPARR